MTPLQIEILLHYYGHADDFRSGDFTAPAVREAIDDFRANEMLVRDDSLNRTYRLGARGAAFIDHITELELPVAQWVMP